MKPKLIKDNILFEDNHLLIINKWPGLLSQGDKSGDLSAVEMVKAYIKEQYNKPGEVFLGLAHRLDRPVSGALMCCRTSKSLTRVNEMIRTRSIRKVYHALCLERPEKESGQIISYLKKDSNKNKVSCRPTPFTGAKEAKLNYNYIGETKNAYHLIEVELETGRPHQIRVQLNSIGCPILGDMKYYRQAPLPDKSIALHARLLNFIHPVKKTEIEVIAKYPDSAWWRINWS